MKVKDFVIKATGANEGEATFEGYLSTYGNEDRDGDIIANGAFDASIARKQSVPLCFNHDRNRVMGRLDLLSDNTGLLVRGILNTKDPFAENIYDLMKMGALDSMSIGMLIKDYEPLDPKRPFGAWRIKQADVVEGSLVTVPANEQAQITAVKEQKEQTQKTYQILGAGKDLEKVKKSIEQARSLL